MKLIPKHTHIFILEKDKTEIIQMLLDHAVLEDHSTPLHTIERLDRKFRGDISPDGFSLVRNVDHRNSFCSVMKGSFAGSNGTEMLHIRFVLPLLSGPFLIVMNVLLLIHAAFTIFIFSSSPWYEDGSSIGAISTTIIVYLLPRLIFEWDYRKLKSLLDGCLAGMAVEKEQGS